jgi:carbon storage regulator CsrA
MGMLVLKRKVEEWVNIHLPDGRLVRVGVIDLGYRNMRLAIDAPRDVSVMRAEIEQPVGGEVTAQDRRLEASQ